MSAGNVVARSREDFQRAIGGLLEAGHAVVEFELDPMPHHVAFDKVAPFPDRAGA